MKQGKIIVFQALRYNGGFATERSLMWMHEVTGLDGSVRGENHSQKTYANNAAQDWSLFTGWPVEQLGRDKSRDCQCRDRFSRDY